MPHLRTLLWLIHRSMPESLNLNQIEKGCTEDSGYGRRTLIPGTCDQEDPMIFEVFVVGEIAL